MAEVAANNEFETEEFVLSIEGGTSTTVSKFLRCKILF